MTTAGNSPSVNVPAMAELALSIQDVQKKFGQTHALAGVSLNVNAGEMVALLGPNGAGKSTLFQILTGLFVADSGNVEVLGVNMRTSPVPALARLGVVFQQPALDLNLSVTANLRFHADLHGIPRKVSTARIADLLSHFDLSALAGKPARSLSGGNRRKIELLRALLHEPALLLMDEATVGLDPASRTQLLDEVLARTSTGGLGVLWATHLVSEAERAHRIVVLHKGQVLFDGAAAQLCEQQGQTNLEAAFLQLTAMPKTNEARSTTS
jgi:ABC-2 type transport system ATP-binding protein